MPIENPDDGEPQGVERQGRAVPAEPESSGERLRKEPGIEDRLESRVEHLSEEPRVEGKVDSRPWAELAKFLKEPTLENLGRVNYQAVETRDVGFMRRLTTLAMVDPDVLRRVVVMRAKLASDIKLTQQEASELLEVLQCQSFPLSGLDINGYGFGRLNMRNAVIGKNLDASFVVVDGDNLQGSMRVGGDNIQVGMVVEGENDQFEMRVGGSNLQSRMKVGGINSQQMMSVFGKNDQAEMEVEGTNRQDYMNVGEDNMQSCMSVGEVNFQDCMKVGGFNLQQGMDVSGSNYQVKMKVGASNDQAGMIIGGDNLQSNMKVGADSFQDGMVVGKDNKQEDMLVSGDMIQGGMVVRGRSYVRLGRAEEVQKKLTAWGRLMKLMGFGEREGK